MLLHVTLNVLNSSDFVVKQDTFLQSAKVWEVTPTISDPQTNDGKGIKHCIGITESPFKMYYSNHKESFKHQDKILHESYKSGI